MAQTKQRLTKQQRNYNNNYDMIENVVAVFRKTDNVERLVNVLATELDNGSFRYLFATEFANVPLTIRYVDETDNETSLETTTTTIEGNK